MNFQGALTSLALAFIIFYLGCLSIGRPDIPMKLVTELQFKALQHLTSNWSCPSAFNKIACHSYHSRRYH